MAKSPPITGVSVAERIMLERRRKGWTLIRLEAETGISMSRLSEIECGLRIPTEAQRKRLAKALNLTDRDLEG